LKFTGACVLTIGLIESMDDFYQTSGGLVVMETTNNVLNQDLWSHVTPQSLFSGQRVRVANMMASSGEQWYHIASKYNSGLSTFFRRTHNVTDSFSIMAVINVL